MAFKTSSGAETYALDDLWRIYRNREGQPDIRKWDFLPVWNGVVIPYINEKPQQIRMSATTWYAIHSVLHRLHRTLTFYRFAALTAGRALMSTSWFRSAGQAHHMAGGRLAGRGSLSPVPFGRQHHPRSASARGHMQYPYVFLWWQYGKWPRVRRFPSVALGAGKTKYDQRVCEQPSWRWRVDSSGQTPLQAPPPNVNLYAPADLVASDEFTIHTVRLYRVPIIR